MQKGITKKDLESLVSQKRFHNTSFFRIKACTSSTKYNKVIFAFSKKSGNAVLRNTFKRRIRALLQQNKQSDYGYNFFFVAKSNFKELTQLKWLEEREKIKKIYHKIQLANH